MIEAIDDRDLLIYWGTPGVQDICNFVWDDRVPELDAPWPHHLSETTDARSMIAMLSGRPDVTGFLYEADELKRQLEVTERLDEFQPTVLLERIIDGQDTQILGLIAAE